MGREWKPLSVHSEWSSFLLKVIFNSKKCKCTENGGIVVLVMAKPSRKQQPIALTVTDTVVIVGTQERPELDAFSSEDLLQFADLLSTNGLKVLRESGDVRFFPASLERARDELVKWLKHEIALEVKLKNSWVRLLKNPPTGTELAVEHGKLEIAAARAELAKLRSRCEDLKNKTFR
jgi:hypothetical protein